MIGYSRATIRTFGFTEKITDVGEELSDIETTEEI